MVSVNEPLRQKLDGPPMTRVALVAGATGATGKYVVKTLLERGCWSKVITIGRKEYNPLSYGFNGLTDEQINKLENVVVENVKDDIVTIKHKFSNVDTVFNCIGTTRAIAGGANNFVEIEFGITQAIATVAKEQGVNHFSVVTAQGANSKVPAVKWFHPMLYTNTLGRKEDIVIQQKFNYTSVFKPGMLNRLTENDHFGAKFVRNILPSLAVDKLAMAMVLDAEHVPKGPVTANQPTEAPLYYIGNNIILQQLGFFT